MASRVGLAGLLLTLACLLGAGDAAPAGSSSIYVVHGDPRLCPSPLCGGYFVALANGARTRCADGLRHPRCYVAIAVAAGGGALGTIPDGSLARAVLTAGRDDLGELRVSAVYPAAGSAAASGRFFSVRDTGLRCVRAPCFSYGVARLNSVARSRVAGVDLAPAKASPDEISRAQAALETTGLYARGRFVRGHAGGRTFRATRLYLRAPLPRA